MYRDWGAGLRGSVKGLKDLLNLRAQLIFDKLQEPNWDVNKVL